MRNNLRTYQNVNRESALSTADPHTVILMLFNGILESISVAKGAIERNELELKSTSLTKAINILRSLQDSLDKESEPKISDNFDALYGYCIDKLMDASVSLELAPLDEVITLLKPLRKAWQDISETDKKDGFALLNEKKQNSDNVAKL